MKEILRLSPTSQRWEELVEIMTKRGDRSFARLEKGFIALAVASFGILVLLALLIFKPFVGL